MVEFIETVPILNKQSINIIHNYHVNTRIMLAFKYLANKIKITGIYARMLKINSKGNLCQKT